MGRERLNRISEGACSEGFPEQAALYTTLEKWEVTGKKSPAYFFLPCSLTETSKLAASVTPAPQQLKSWGDKTVNKLFPCVISGILKPVRPASSATRM